MKTIFSNLQWKNVKKSALSLFSVLALIILLKSCNRDHDDNVMRPEDTMAYKTLNNDMRKLWADHMQYTFSTVDAFFNNPEALDANLTRLLQNQQDLGNAIKPFYGDAAGNQLATLLTEHIQLAVPVLSAAQAGDSAALNTALANWYTNAQQIADFLADANPNWNRAEMRDMMKMHIDQTTAYSVKLLEKKYPEAIQIFEEANHHMRMMADDLTAGISKQFPEKFIK